MADTERTANDSGQHTARDQDVAPAWKPSGHEWAIMLTLAIISLMVSLDATVIITSLSTIIQALKTDTTQGLWIGTSYLLTCAVTMPFTAALSDIVGRSRCLFASLIFFTVGTILCAAAHNISVMLAGRSIQGIGGGGVIVLSLVIFTDIVPLRSRPQYVGILQGAWAVGTCVGPLIGGAFATPTLWRGVFYLMFPFCGIGLVFVPLFIRLTPRRATWRQMLTRVDWAGGLLFIPSAAAFLLAISWGGTEQSWASAQTIIPLIAGFLGLICTGLYEQYRATEPFLPHSLFRNPTAFAIYAGAFVQGLLLYGQLYYIPFFLETVKLKSPIQTGVGLLAVMLALIPTAVVVGRLITRTGSYRWAIWIGWVLTTLATGLTTLWSAHSWTTTWVLSLVTLGIGHGLLLNALNCASQAVCKPGDEGAAAAMYAFLRSFGMALGVGIGGSVFQNVMKIRLRALHLPTSILGTPQRVAVYAYGFHGVFGFFCGLAALAMAVSCFIKHFEINKELVTEHTLDTNSRIALTLGRLNHSRTPSQFGSLAESVPEDRRVGFA
ncbi:hypothetical protein PV05_00904 [Exophiala xenobiotica]|uniref:Major facilitator superfamily (MFS) profile domain-containing protein n=1 Tax=Exophiala xenobiotica TaxID=348802 RepID=A0A0D2F180_9EURO|nr:uncharacterized protein PV05_00904 [Exophiala xenobiotica]KIW60705.1 hypothetical protein PV05_00904 [Exophiala xenobiotica]